MSEAAEKAFEHFKADVGNDEGTGEWFEVTQSQIDQFADITHDHQFIHVDPERAKATPFGTTIAHGFLTLSMLTHLSAGTSSAPPNPAKYEELASHQLVRDVTRAMPALASGRLYVRSGSRGGQLHCLQVGSVGPTEP